ncbi:DUF427-domain-containing protein [Corynespora cassiicola Philippines]|uniref:DUF427-domain-containing protein n=1 Tax=Corynespora cassiicola Philippines TaxID=1448308 RepID=A0A2T2NK33_CORCC|nr:DUF427-domain-containing protein [Corynespora cassiicola Philippines]
MPHATASVNGITVAETDTYELVDGNVYFPPAALKTSHFTPSTTTTYCPYKGTASYFTVTTGKTEVADAAWSYAEPKTGFERIEGWVAFYGGRGDVEVKKE